MQDVAEFAVDKVISEIQDKILETLIGDMDKKIEIFVLEAEVFDEQGLEYDYEGL